MWLESPARSRFRPKTVRIFDNGDCGPVLKACGAIPSLTCWNVEYDILSKPSLANLKHLIIASPTDIAVASTAPPLPFRLTHLDLGLDSYDNDALIFDKLSACSRSTLTTFTLRDLIPSFPVVPLSLFYPRPPQQPSHPPTPHTPPRHRIPHPPPVHRLAQALQRHRQSRPSLPLGPSRLGIGRVRLDLVPGR